MLARLVVVAFAALLLPDVADCLVLCAAKDRGTGLPREGATLRLRSSCKISEAMVTPFIGAAQESVIENHESRIAALEPPVACPPDAVLAGGACVDKYEASLWDIPAIQTAVIAKVKTGTVTLADLQAAGATQVGCTSGQTGGVFDMAAIPEESCPIYSACFGFFNTPIYAVAIPGVLPTTCVSAYQARAACALSEKRLPSFDEWSSAAAGTPDPDADNGTTDCNTGNDGESWPNYPHGIPTNLPSVTGARPFCVSSAGVYDALGNAIEWTDGDWNPWHRGGHWLSGSEADIEIGDNGDWAMNNNPEYGVRCAR